MKAGPTILIAIVFVMAATTIVLGQEINWMPIRSAPLGSPVGTVGAPVTPQFNAELGCWEVVVSGGVEVDLDLQASGWGNAAGSPTLVAIQGTVDPSGYSNGVGGDLNPKGWPGSPLDGAYQANKRCEVGGDLSPCSPPFDPTCDGDANGDCVHASNWVMPICAADFPAFVTTTLAYAWAAAAQVDCNIDDGLVKTMGGLILEVPANAAGTYTIALDPVPNSSFMFSGAGSPIPGLTFTPACITVITDRTLTEPGGPCTCFGENGECLDDATGETHPVYLFSGEKYESVVDMRIPGRGIDFVWSRKYRSRIGPDTAMGNGWDFSYNIRLMPLGPDLILHNGRTRSDTYNLQPDGTWSRREFFRVIEQNPDDSYTLTHSDTSRWEFQPLDGSPHEGKITASVDRNGNTISFDYDGLGRLVTIHDTLDTAAHNRDITIAYNDEGFIESVTDFAGRSVRHTYYGGTEVPTSPALAAAPHDILKNRYISINPRNAGLVFFDIRLTLTSTQVNGVPGGQIGSQWWASKPDGKCISIVGPNQPTTPPDWSGCPTVHLTGCPIIPTSSYDIVAVFEGNVSDPPLAAATQAKPGVKWWCDCVGQFNGVEWSPPNGSTNIDDTVAAIKTFQDINGFNATHVSVADLEPALNGSQINKIVNFNDVLLTILGFQGFEYPGPAIDLCSDSPPPPPVGPRGNFGDLKSVTTPIVENTTEFPIPPGHDYPDGKTTVYTYSTGFADDRLNHNLLAITDPKGRTYLRNEYYATTDPSDLDFDRVKRQTWGDDGDVIDIVYVEQTPDESNHFATIKAILNDRVGNVKEYFYDAGNRNVITLEYTGRADPDLPTTESDNRPTGKLRPGDPDVFETRYEYNNDSLRTKIVDANGNVVVASYDEENASRRSQGNMTQSCTQAGPLGGDQAEICESYEYDDNFGGCCGTNFITRHVDGRGNETLHTYDSNGNRLHTQHRIPSIVEDFEYNEFGQVTAHTLPDNGSVHRRRDEYTYYDSGAQLGYLHQAIVDAPNFALITTYEYNLVGQTTRVTDPRGHGTPSIVNQLDQTVRTISREVADGGGVRYERDAFYDPNDNVVRVDIQNIDDQGVEQSNTHVTEIYEYEILDYRTKTCQEVGDYTGTIPGSQAVPLCRNLPDSEFLSTEYAYDADRNRTLVRNGEAVEGRQLTNVVETFYDERDLTFRVIRAPGDPDQSTTQFDYDNNRNLVRVTQGIEDVAAPRITTTTYDGYDRLLSTTDPMGNVAEYHYDPNSNIGGFQDAAETNRNPFAVRGDGELDDVTGSAGNVRLTESWIEYDEMDRVIRTEVEFFDTDTQTPLQGGQQLGKAITTTEYNDNSQVARVVNDNGHQTLTAYDTANRRGVVTDHLNNSLVYTYDENSNVTAMTEVEKSDLGNPDELFTTTFAYDNLDRLVQTLDNVGNTHSHAYDSRSNRTLTNDALEHETRYVYDGINRLIATIRDLDDDGPDGDGPDITTTRTWDDDSRLTGQGDDNGNITTYVYDALNRLTAEVYADDTVHDYIYDVHDNKTQMTDANGSVADCAYDLLDRLIDKTIDPGDFVSNDTTFEVYKYDGLSRLIHAEDDDSIVTRSYNSLSRNTRETLNGETTTCDYDGVGNELLSTYPGGRMIFMTYDGLERKKTIHDGSDEFAPLIAAYDYVGPGRVERREYGNGTRTDYTYDGITGEPNPADDFGVKRIINTTHSVIAGGATIDDRTYTWDKMYNKTQRADVRGGPRLTHNYTYDSVYRLVHTTVTEGMPPLTVRDTDYTLDGVGNREIVTGQPNPGPYTMDATEPDPADFQMNQYTTIPSEARAYDENGNLIRIDDPGPGGVTVRSITYDYRNQMVSFRQTIFSPLHTYAYDALGRRIARRGVQTEQTPCGPNPAANSCFGGASCPAGSACVAGGCIPGSCGCDPEFLVFVCTDDCASQCEPSETRYFYDGWRVVEERNQLGATSATYVYGLYIDEVLNMRRSSGISHCSNDPEVACTVDSDCPGAGICVPDPTTDYYYHTDDLYNVMAVTDAAGTVAERYDYQDYGRPADPTMGEPIDNPQSTIANPYRFTGRRFDPETGWYYYRTRYLDPLAGRFTTRDIIGIWGDNTNLGNGSTYLSNRPWSYLDPTGRRESCVGCAKEARAVYNDNPWNILKESHGYVLVQDHDPDDEGLWRMGVHQVVSTNSIQGKKRCQEDFLDFSDHVAIVGNQVIVKQDSPAGYVLLQYDEYYGGPLAGFEVMHIRDDGADEGGSVNIGRDLIGETPAGSLVDLRFTDTANCSAEVMYQESFTPDNRDFPKPFAHITAEGQFAARQPGNSVLRVDRNDF